MSQTDSYVSNGMSSRIGGISCLALNVCGVLSKLRYPEFMNLITKFDIVTLTETNLDDIDTVEVPGYVPFYKNRAKYRRKSGGILLLVREELVKQVTILESKYLVSKVDSKVKKYYRFVDNDLCPDVLFFQLSGVFVDQGFYLVLFMCRLKDPVIKTENFSPKLRSRCYCLIVIISVFSETLMPGLPC